MPNKCIKLYYLLFISLGLFIHSNVFAQKNDINLSKTCGTMGLYKPGELERAASFPFPNNILGKSGQSWSVNTGYGDNCTLDCNVSPYDNAPQAGCNGAKYEIPFAFTVIRECGTGNLPDGFTDINALIAKLDDQVNEVNTYYDCIGFPVVLRKCTSHGQGTESDNSTRLITDATLCSFTGSTGPGTDNEYANSIDIENLMNIYIAEEVNGSMGCNGFAFLPTSSTAPNRMVMQASCFNSFASPPTDPCNDPGRAITFVHEVGHYLGLYHTHTPHEQGNPNSGSTAYALPSDNGCTEGDLIADTGADPNLRVYGVDSPGGNSCKDVVNGTTDDNAFNTQTNPALDFNNIMSYNSLVGCRFNFTDCQQAKMLDALLCARSSHVCCDPNVTASEDASDYMTSPILTICQGDDLPTFLIDNPTGAAPNLTTTCIGWYADPSGGDLLTTGSSFTVPSTGAAAVNNNVPGVYSFYFDADVNQYTTSVCDDYALKVVQLVITEDSGDASPTTFDASTNGTISAVANGTTVNGNDIIGWYFSDDNPVSTLTTQASIQSAINAATTTTGTVSSLNTILQSTTGSPKTTLSSFGANCASIGGDNTYYLTPFIAYGDKDIICTESTNSIDQEWNFGGNPPTQNGARTNAPTSPISCNTGGLTNFTYTISVTLTELSGTNSGGVRLYLRNENGCTGFGGSDYITLDCATPPCIGTFSQAIIDNVFTSFDPTVDRVCVSAIDKNFAGDLTTKMTYSVQVEVQYTGDNAATIWTNDGSPRISVPENNPATCFWGTPMTISCGGSVPLTWGNFTGSNKGEVNYLKWSTKTEVNNDFFTIERSDNGHDFYKIGTVNGNGTSIEQNNYQFIDKKPLIGINYYRLLQTDIDNHIDYHPRLLTIDLKDNRNITIFPNPLQGQSLQLDFQTTVSDEVIYEVYNINGKLMHTETGTTVEGQNTHFLNLSDLAQGVYHLQVYYHGKIETLRFVKM